VFSPIAENINYSTRAELLNQKLVLEGVVAISKEQNSYKLERKLASFLSPAEREGKTETLRRITRKYVQRKKQPVELADMADAEGTAGEGGGEKAEVAA
jgi:chemotaxis protein MotA